MRVVVGYDRSPAAQEALRWAVAAVSVDGGTVHAIYVGTQVELDGTGALTFETKREALLSALYPQLWKEIGPFGEDADGVELDLQLRLAPVHLTRSQARIAEELVKAVTEYDADTLVLGRHGRPGSVADAVVASMKQISAGPPLVFERQR